MTINDSHLLEAMNALLPHMLAAGNVAMEIYARDFEVERKDDLSPVTEADLAVDRYLAPHLASIFRDIPVVTEEQSANHGMIAGDREFLLVDPIDGTKEFIRKTGEFTINVAFVRNGSPVAGIVHTPALGRTFLGVDGIGAWEKSAGGEPALISTRPCPAEDRVAIASKSHLTRETEDFLAANRLTRTSNAGSSLKFCVLAAGEADIYPRFGPTMEWDTAAGHAVLSAAGGMVLTEDRKPLRYGKPGFRNPNFVACTRTIDFTFCA